MKATCQ
ncbi:hypothetical protein CGLO_18259 [Colletotrichum gloeosporioides Cg-14]|nr:hypothetical protein CGLO_18259 [Colletotrichum gloeosporioides Cg-14]